MIVRRSLTPASSISKFCASIFVDDVIRSKKREYCMYVCVCVQLVLGYGKFGKPFTET